MNAGSWGIRRIRLEQGQWGETEEPWDRCGPEAIFTRCTKFRAWDTEDQAFSVRGGVGRH